MTGVDPVAQRKWNDLDVAWRAYQAFLNRKTERHQLDYIDLLFVRNFKAGNASIVDGETAVNNALISYSDELREIERRFGDRKLSELDPQDLDNLSQIGDRFLRLTITVPIKGFGPSYASALLSAIFPSLFPILDRRALNGAGIVPSIPKSGQVYKIAKYYSQLIKEYHALFKTGQWTTIREIDRSLFERRIKRAT